ncbi:MAG: histidine phosphatase family protein [Clostridia bacterium]|nr:histidine phosphatase family protein [Clostridia bacterium]
MNIYVMRHGTTIWNEKGIFQGRSNNRLSKQGIDLVEKCSIDCKNISFDIIYSSPLMRTMQTANIINKYHNVKIIKDERLIEIDEGIFTRRLKSSLTTNESFAQEHRLDGYNMESWKAVHNRIEDFVKYIKDNCTYENILIVSHDTPATCIENILTNKKINYNQDMVYRKNFNNAEIRHYII